MSKYRSNDLATDHSAKFNSLHSKSDWWKAITYL